jgi:hypothetical protein
MVQIIYLERLFFYEEQEGHALTVILLSNKTVKCRTKGGRESSGDKKKGVGKK